MKPETLDTLLLDRALGELSPEVTALLDSHLAQNPDAARRAAEFSATLDLARAAVATPRQTPRPLDVARLQREQRFVGAPSRTTTFLRLAACLALGLGLGWFARPTPKPTAALVAAPAALATPTVLVLPHTPEPSTQFWSVARFAPNSADARPKKDL